MSLTGLFEEYKDLINKLKNRDYESILDRNNLQIQADNYRENIKDKLEKENERQRKVQVILRGIGFATANKAIFRVEGNKIMKTWEQIEGYSNHMCRAKDGIAANPELTEFNTVLFGDKLPHEALQKYYERYGLKQFGKGANKTRLATDLLYSVSPQFFYIPGTKKCDFDLIDKWVDTTMQYLKNEYGTDLVWVQLDLDESSPHLHVLVVGREWHSKWQKEVVSHAKHFGGKGKLMTLQDNYANALQRGGFLVQRGLRGSKATHKSVERWKAEQKARDNQISNIEDNTKDIISLKDREREEAVNKELIGKQARNKVLRDVCISYNINPTVISKAIDDAEKELIATKQKYQEHIKNKNSGKE